LQSPLFQFLVSKMEVHAGDEGAAVGPWNTKRAESAAKVCTSHDHVSAHAAAASDDAHRRTFWTAILNCGESAMHNTQDNVHRIGVSEVLKQTLKAAAPSPRRSSRKMASR
jgi:hypothetical protein